MRGRKGPAPNYGVSALNWPQPLHAVQIGLTPPIAKVLKGLGGEGVLELIEDGAGGTYRAVYTVSYSSAVYVLHVFQKKSKRGKQTSQRDIDLIKERLKHAAEIHQMTVTRTSHETQA